MNRERYYAARREFQRVFRMCTRNLPSTVIAERFPTRREDPRVVYAIGIPLFRMHVATGTPVHQLLYPSLDSKRFVQVAEAARELINLKYKSVPEAVHVAQGILCGDGTLVLRWDPRLPAMMVADRSLPFVSQRDRLIALRAFEETFSEAAAHVRVFLRVHGLEERDDMELEEDDEGSYYASAKRDLIAFHNHLFPNHAIKDTST